jgi:putative nucleotidyltransferase with HDIG domain
MVYSLFSLAQGELAPTQQVTGDTSLSEIVAALSYALDITEGQPQGHAARTCLIGMRIADEIGLPSTLRPALFYALLLKDLGCSSNAAQVCALLGDDDRLAKADMKLTNWSFLPSATRYGLRHLAPNRSLVERTVQLIKLGLNGGPLAAKLLFEIRCDRGADFVRRLGFPEAAGEAIRALDEHWNGRGYPLGLRGDAIPLLGRILCLAQTVDIFCTTFGQATAFDVALERSGSWFDPTLVDALRRFRHDTAFWATLSDPRVDRLAAALEPPGTRSVVSQPMLDRIAETFAEIIDAKSPWTYRHSEGVAVTAVRLAQILGLCELECRDLRRAALLHDIGKLGISNLIIDKPGPLTPQERATMQQHAFYTRRLLEHVPIFQNLADLAASHHERPDGRGYLRGLHGDQLSLPARILATADFCDALTADRPYRNGLSAQQTLAIAKKEAGTGLCATCVTALETILHEEESPHIRPAHASEPKFVWA